MYQNLNDKEKMNLMSFVNYDITGCLINCSNHGSCKLLNGEYKCTCGTDFYGSYCDKTKKVCQLETKCLNSGTCVDLVQYINNSKNIEYNYKCLCGENFYGQNCENEIDLCENKTCSSNGFCNVNKNKTAECECYKYFSGENCEIKSNDLIIIQNIIKISLIISVIIISNVYLLMIGNDLMNIFKYFY